MYLSQDYRDDPERVLRLDPTGHCAPAVSRLPSRSLKLSATQRLTLPSRQPRSRTIIDFDKVLLLDKGRLIEYESPAKLLDDPTSRFYALCRATGKKEFAILKKMSKGKSRVTHRPRKVR